LEPDCGLSGGCDKTAQPKQGRLAAPLSSLCILMSMLVALPGITRPGDDGFLNVTVCNDGADGDLCQHGPDEERVRVELARSAAGTPDIFTLRP
jgi:hypothetical protein